jgi:Spy/CpxP family protein refolding chaperone
MLWEWELKAYNEWLSKGGEKMSECDWQEQYKLMEEEKNEERLKAQAQAYDALTPEERKKQDNEWSSRF